MKTTSRILSFVLLFAGHTVSAGKHRLHRSDSLEHIASHELVIRAQKTTTLVICQGTCITLKSNSKVPNKIYSWYPEDRFTDVHKMEQQVCPEQTSYYDLLITNKDGTVLEEESFVVQVIPLSTNISPSPPLVCPGKPMDIYAANGMDSYIWKDKKGRVMSVAQMATISQPGLYSLTVLKGNCKRTGPVEVGRYVVPKISIIPQQYSICEAEIRLTSSPGFVSHSWMLGNSIYADGGEEIIIDEPGVYQLTGTDVHGCTQQSLPLTITKSLLEPEIIPFEKKICNQGLLTLHVDAVYDRYEWKNALGKMLSDSQQVTVDRSGYYSLFVEKNGCSAEAEFSVEESPVYDIFIAPLVPTICVTAPYFGSQSTNSIDSNMCYPSAMLEVVIPDSVLDEFHYYWSTGQSNAAIEVTEIGLYSLSITDGYGCRTQKEIAVLPCLGGLSLKIMPELVYLCSINQPVELNAGSGFDTYKWSTGETTQKITVNKPGEYSVTVSHISNMGTCFATDKVIVGIL